MVYKVEGCYLVQYDDSSHLPVLSSQASSILKLPHSSDTVMGWEGSMMVRVDEAMLNTVGLELIPDYQLHNLPHLDKMTNRLLIVRVLPSTILMVGEDQVELSP